MQLQMQTLSVNGPLGPTHTVTMITCISDCDHDTKWIPFISLVLFILSDAKRERAL